MKKSKYFLLLLLFVPVLFFVGCDEKTKAKNFYEIDAKYSEREQTLSCNQKTTYHNNSENALSFVSFFLYPNAFLKENNAVSSSYKERAYPNGESYGNITFQKIQIENCDCEYTFGENKNVVRVNLKEKLFPTEQVCIEFDYVVSLANINHRLGYGENCVNFGGFFPIACVYENGFVENQFANNGDPFYSETADFEVKITYPNDFVLASSGVQTKFEDHTLCKAENVRDFCFVLSKDFSVIQKEIDGVEINYFFYDDEKAGKHLETATKAVTDFSQMFGDYPYKQLSVVKTGFCFGGMEYPNLVMISDDAREDFVDYVIVHEIAHQWWYSLVGNNEFSESFVDESLTEYSTLLFFEKEYEYGLSYASLVENAAESYKNFVKIYTKIQGSVDQRMDRNLLDFNTEPEYVHCVYTKGVLMYDCLRQILKDKIFFRCLKNYFNDYKFKIAKRENLIESFSKSANRNLKPFFDSWLDGKVVVE